MSQVTNKQEGFTIIELMISMGFIAILLIALASIVIQVSNIYSRGITLKDVNEAGRSIIDDLKRNISEAPPMPLENFDAKTGRTLANNLRYVPQPAPGQGGGRLCLGKYTYLWNTQQELQKTSGWRNIYSDKTGRESAIVFAKVKDTDGSLCIKPNSQPRKVDASVTTGRPSANELLDTADRFLVVHDFRLSGSGGKDDAGDQYLYNLLLTIGTSDSSALTGGAITGGAPCKPPSQAQGLENYCSVNTFELTARAGSNQ